jgi:hypothetical protein
MMPPIRPFRLLAVAVVTTAVIALSGTLGYRVSFLAVGCEAGADTIRQKPASEF